MPRSSRAILGAIIAVLTFASSAGAATWTTPVDLAASNQNLYGVTVAAGGTGHAEAAWQQYDGTRWHIWAAPAGPGGTWGTPVDLTTAAGVSSSEPRLAMDAAGNAVAIWQTYTNSTSGLQTARYSAAAGTWSAPVSMSTGGMYGAGGVQIAASSSGDAFATWYAYDGSVQRAMVARFSAMTGTWGTPTPLSQAGISAVNPQVALDASGNAVFAWSEYSGSGYRTMATRYTASSDAWSSKVQLSTTPTTNSDTQVAVNASGAAVVAWTYYEGSSQRLWTARSAAGSTTWGTAVSVSSTGQFVNEPRIALSATGDAFAVWYSWDGSSYRISRAIYTAATATWAAQENFTPAADNTGMSQIVADGAGNATMAWYRDTPGSGTGSLAFSRYTASTGTWDTATNLVPFVGNTSANAPRLAVDGSNNVFAVWSYYDGAGSKPQASFFQSGVSVTSPASDGYRFAGDPTFAFSADNLTTHFQCRIDGGAWQSCATGYSVTHASLTTGAHSLEVQALDASDAVRSSTTRTFVNNAPPAAGGDLANAGTLVFGAGVTAANVEVSPTLTDSDSGTPTQARVTSIPSGATLKSADGTTTLAVGDRVGIVGGKLSLRLTPAVAADAVIGYKIVDPLDSAAAGDSSASSISVDVAPAKPVITGRPALTGPRTNVRFRFAAGGANLTYRCSIDGAAEAACASGDRFVVATGDHTFSVYAKDADGDNGEAASYAWTTAPATLPFTGTVDAGDDPAVAADTDTGIAVTSGQALKITASGTWSCGTGCSSGPQGLGYDGSVKETSAPKNALIGRIGTTGRWFTIGAGPTIVKGSGELYLANNDADNSDNDGAVDVTVATTSLDVTIVNAPAPAADKLATAGLGLRAGFTATSGTTTECSFDGGATWAACTSPVRHTYSAGSGAGRLAIRATDTTTHEQVVAIAPLWNVSGGGGGATISVGSSHACAVKTDASLSCWGYNSWGQASAPTGSFTAAGAGESYTCGLKSDGTISCWGYYGYNTLNPPSGTFSALAVGVDFACALTGAGAAQCWGNTGYGQTQPPAATFTQIGAASQFACGIKADGTLACWGRNYEGELNVPSGTFTQVSLGNLSACALRTDGTVACWGNNSNGNTQPPAGTYSQVAVGSNHSCAIKPDGTVVCWGYTGDSRATPAAGTFSAIDIGDATSCGVRTTGALACWGPDYNGYGLGTPPAGTFAAGGSAGGVGTATVASPATDGYRFAGDPAFSFSAKDATHFECRIDGGAWVNCDGGSYGVTHASLSIGSHTFEVEGYDDGGSLGASATRTFVNNTAPSAAGDHNAVDPGTTDIAHLVYGATVGAANVEVSPTIADADSGTPTQARITTIPSSFTVKTADGTPVSAGARVDLVNGTLTLRVTPGSGADGTLVYKIVDPLDTSTAGDSAPSDLLVDVVPDRPAFTKTPSATDSRTIAHFAFATTTPSATYECSLDGAAYAACTSNQATILTEGARTFDVRAIDPDGDRGAAAHHAWTVDTSAQPVVTTVAAADAPSSDAAATGIAVTPAQSLKVSATGTVTCGTGCTGRPEGQGYDGSAVEPSVPRGALMGRVGTTGHWFPIGAGPTLVKGNGELHLAINDTSYGDNSGSLSVTIARASLDAAITVGPRPSANALAVTGADVRFDFTATSGATLECSFDNGSTWSGCTSGAVHTFATSGTAAGSFRLRATKDGDTVNVLSPLWTIAGGKSVVWGAQATTQVANPDYDYYYCYYYGWSEYCEYTTGYTGSAGTIGDDLTGAQPRVTMTGSSNESRPRVASDGTWEYFTDQNTGYIGRVALDGSQSQPNWIYGGQPRGLAVVGDYLYWTNGQYMGRAKLDGSTYPEQNWTYLNGYYAYDLAAGSGYLYYTDNYSAIGRLSLSTGSNQGQFINSNTSGNSGLGVDGQHVYWAYDYSIGRADIDGTNANSTWRYVGNQITDVASDGSTIYYTTENGTLGRMGTAGLAIGSPVTLVSGVVSSVELGGSGNPVARPTITSPAADGERFAGDPTFAFSATNASHYECRIDAGAWAACATGYSVTHDSLSIGTHTLKIRGYDDNGSIGPETTRSFINNIVPAAGGNLANAGSLVYGAPVTAANVEASPTLTDSDSGTPTQARLTSVPGSATVKSADGTQTLTGGSVVGLTGGKLALQVTPGSASDLTIAYKIIDPADTSTAGDSAASNLTIDVVPDAPAITTKPDATDARTAVRFAFAATAGALTYECRIDGAAFTACISGQSFAVGDGAHTFRVRAKDADNDTGSAASYTWTTDGSQPVATTVGSAVAPASAQGTGVGVTPSQSVKVTATGTVTCGTGCTGGPEGQGYDGAAVETSVPRGALMGRVGTSGRWFAIGSGPTLVKGDGELYLAVNDSSYGDNSGSFTVTIERTSLDLAITAGPLPTNVKLASSGTTARLAFSSATAGVSFDCSYDTGTTWSACVSPDVHSYSTGAGTGRFRVRATKGGESVSVIAPLWHVGAGADKKLYFTQYAQTYGYDADLGYSTWKYSYDAGSANTDLTGISSGLFPTVAQSYCCLNQPRIASDGTYLYWADAQNGRIGRSLLDGSGRQPAFIPNLGGVTGVAVDNAHVYWTSNSASIGRAAIDGTGVTTNWLPTSQGNYDLAVSATNVYWSSYGGTIGRAKIDGTQASDAFVSGVYASNIAIDAGHIYWPAYYAIGRADIDGTNVLPRAYDLNYSNYPQDVASDGTTVYFTGWNGLASMPVATTGFVAAQSQSVPGNSLGSLALADTPLATIGAPAISSPSADGQDFDTAPTFTFSAPGATSYDCRVDGGTWHSCDNGSYTTSLQGLTGEDHTFDVRSFNAAGTVGGTATRTFTATPVVPNQKPVAGGDATVKAVAGGARTITIAPSTLSDPDGTTPAKIRLGTVTGGTLLESGVLTLTSGKADVTFTPSGTADGSIAYTVVDPDTNDAADDSASSTVTVDVINAPSVTGAGTQHVAAAGDGAAIEPALEIADADSAQLVSATVTVTGFDGNLDNLSPGGALDADQSTEGQVTFSGAADVETYEETLRAVTFAGMVRGSRTVTWTVEDADGLTGVHTTTITIGDDATPETTIESAEPVLTNDKTADFTFSSDDPDATFECNVDHGGFVGCSTPFATESLDDGQHNLAVRAVDANGNKDASSAIRSWTVDTAAPNTTITASEPSPSSDATGDFAFSSPDGTATFECKVDGGQYAPCTTPFATSALSDGSHTFSVRAVDAAGNTDATPATASWTLDTVAPTTTIVASEPSPTNDPTADFTFTSDDATATFECQVDSGAYTACASPLATTALSDGSHTFRVRAVDAAGNADATPDSASWTLDTAAPGTTLTTQEPSPTADTTADFTFTSDDANATFECKVDSGVYTACSSPFSTPALSDGAHTFAVRAVDAAHNPDPTPATAAWTLDTATDATAPATTFDTKPSPLSATKRPDATFHSDEAATFTCAVYPQGGSAAGFTACAGADSTHGAFHQATDLADGAWRLAVKAKDAAGNTSTATTDFTIDSTVPSITITRPDQGARYSNTQSESAVWSCSASGLKSITACTATDNGAAIANGAELPNALGTHTFVVTATDSTGLTTTATRTYDVVAFATMVTDDDPVAYFRLGDASGSSAMGSSTNRTGDGEFKNATESEASGISGDGNSARHFSGDSGYGYVNNVEAPKNASTMMTWVRFDEVRDSSFMDHGYDNGLYLENRRFAFRHVGDVISDQRSGAQFDVEAGKWYMVVGRWNGHKMDLLVAKEGQSKYVPPVLVATGASDRKASGYSTLYLGFGQDHAWLHGSMDETAYFDKAVSDAHLAEVWLADPPAVISASAPATAAPVAPLAKPATPVVVASKPATDSAAKARIAKARAKVVAATKALARAKATLKTLQKHFASRRAITAARKTVAKRTRALAAARRALSRA